MNILYDPCNENVIIMQDDSSIYIINKVGQLPEEKLAKIAKRENGSSTEDSNSISNSQYTFKVVKKYKVSTKRK
jgi:hypothetical protein